MWMVHKAGTMIMNLLSEHSGNKRTTTNCNKCTVLAVGLLWAHLTSSDIYPVLCKSIESQILVTSLPSLKLAKKEKPIFIQK